MFTASPNEYAKLSDDELLQLSSDRSSLTDEAKLVLEAEMRNRNLTALDVSKHEEFVRRSEQRERRRRNRKLFGNRWTRLSWIETAVMLFWTATGISLISIFYLALPAPYHLPDKWEESAKYVMFSSVFLVAASSELRPKKRFWISLLMSSSAHLFIVHAWIVHFGTFYGKGRRADQWPILLGPLLFLIVYGCVFQLRRKLYGEDDDIESTQ